MRDRLIEIIKSSLIKHIDKSCKLAENITDDLLSEGVIVPPCKVGDKIYAHWNCGKHGKSVAEFTVEHIDIDYLPEIEIAYRSRTLHSGTYHFAKLKDFGKTVFLTREEAEKALAERSENGT